MNYGNILNRFITDNKYLNNFDISYFKMHKLVNFIKINKLELSDLKLVFRNVNGKISEGNCSADFYIKNKNCKNNDISIYLFTANIK